MFWLGQKPCAALLIIFCCFREFLVRVRAQVMMRDDSTGIAKMDLTYVSVRSSSRRVGGWWGGGIVFLASCEHYFIRVHEYLVQHPSNNISIILTYPCSSCVQHHGFSCIVHGSVTIIACVGIFYFDLRW